MVDIYWWWNAINMMNLIRIGVWVVINSSRVRLLKMGFSLFRMKEGGGRGINREYIYNIYILSINSPPHPNFKIYQVNDGPYSSWNDDHDDRTTFSFYGIDKWILWEKINEPCHERGWGGGINRKKFI
jgi:hypothetical protein